MSHLTAATLPSAALSTRRGGTRSRVRRTGAAAAAAALLGTFVIAPFSLSQSVASAEVSLAHLGQQHQALTLLNTADPALHLTVADLEQAASETVAPSGAEVSLSDFLFRGVINWGGYKFTFYSQQVLPGGGLDIPGRHVNAAGYVSDGDGFIVLAGSAPKGTVYDTPFGYQGKIYDRGTVGNHLDVYIR